MAGDIPSVQSLDGNRIQATPVFIVGDGSGTSAKPSYTTAAALAPKGYQQISTATLAASTALTPPAGSSLARVQNNGTQPVRYRDDGVAPTATTGLRLGVGQLIDYSGDLAAFRAIREADGSILDIAYYGLVQPLAISGSMGTAVVGTPYSFTPTTTGGMGARTYSANGPLPAGLSINSATGAITGTPTATGSLPGITVTDTTGSATLPAASSAVVAATPVGALGTLSFSGALTQNIATSGTIIGATTGSYIVSNVPGITVNSGARTYSGTPSGSAVTVPDALVETLQGANNSPNASPATVLPLGGVVLASWDARNGVTASAGLVSSWTDQKTSLAATQTTTAAQPAYGAAAWDGTLPAITFDGAETDTDFLGATAPFAQNQWVFIVAERGTQNANVATTRTLYTTARSMGGARGDIMIASAADDGGLGKVRVAGAGSGSAVAETTGWVAGKALVFAQLDSAAVGVSVNGGAVVTGGAFGATTRATVRMGTAQGGASSFAGKFAQVVVVDSTGLTTADRQYWEGRLAWSWGLQGSLPSNHPYKNAPPPGNLSGPAPVNAISNNQNGFVLNDQAGFVLSEAA